MFINPSDTIRTAMKAINKNAQKCLVVVDSVKTLLGTLSDGDIRKAILNGEELDNSIKKIYNSNPKKLLFDKYAQEDIKMLFLKNKFDLIPIVDDYNKIVDIILWEKFFNGENKSQPIDAPVVIMAGGKGNRLNPFTTVLPKPLIPVQGKPMIQHVIERFSIKGMKEFYVTINYKGRILKAYLQEWGTNYNFNFIEEEKPLGTAGSLYLLKEYFKEPFFVTNCDILINTDYRKIYDFHIKNSFDITLIASAKEITIPYGTCHLDSDGHLLNIEEKPQFDFLINTGLYLLEPSVLKSIPNNEFYHITSLIQKIKTEGKKIGVYPINDDEWIDVGQWEEYKKAINKLG